MNKFYFTLFLAISLSSLPAADVQWNFSDFTGSALPLRRVYLTPLSGPGAIGSSIGMLDRRTFTNSSSGTLIVSNVAAGLYEVDFMGPFQATSITNSFPDTNGLLNAKDYLVTSTNTPAGQVAYTQSASDQRYQLRILSAVAAPAAADIGGSPTNFVILNVGGALKTYWSDGVTLYSKQLAP